MGMQGDGQRWAQAAPTVVSGDEAVDYRGLRGWMSRHFLAVIGGLAVAVVAVAIVAALV
jgi:hypothetical protein